MRQCSTRDAPRDVIVGPVFARLNHRAGKKPLAGAGIQTCPPGEPEYEGGDFAWRAEAFAIVQPAKLSKNGGTQGRLMSTSGKRVAIVQSSYIPWKGYFDLIRASDEFILLDDVQFTKRDWRSRNQIKTQHGLAWLTIPVRTKGRYHQLIQEAEISDPHWGEAHWATLRANYAGTPFFKTYAAQLAALYDPGPGTERLSDVNHRFITALCTLLGITTPIRWSTEYGAPAG